MIDFVEAYLCCVAKAEDDQGKYLALPLDYVAAHWICKSLEKNLAQYGYKIVSTK